MPSQLLHFKGLYGEQKAPFKETAVHLEPLKKRSSIFNYEINEHLHTDLIQIFIIEKGEGALYSEGKKIILKTPCISVIPSGVLHGFAWQPETIGQVLTASVFLFENMLKDAEKVLMEFQELQHFSYDKQDVIFKELTEILRHLDQELHHTRIEKNIAIQLLLKLLMIKLYRNIVAKKSLSMPTNNRMLMYFNAFQREISLDVYNAKTIKEYAKAINITPVHLNRVCQTLVQKTSLQVVHEKLIRETKKYLLNTNDTIAEIAYSFNFKEPSHFSKFFKKKVGISPQKFRQSKDHPFQRIIQTKIK